MPRCILLAKEVIPSTGGSTGFLLAIGTNYSGPVTLRGELLPMGIHSGFGQVDVGVVRLVAHRVIHASGAVRSIWERPLHPMANGR